MTLKLEVGKTYVTADGTPVKIVDRDDAMHYPFNGSNGDCYMENGRLVSDMFQDDGDLIAGLQAPGTTSSPVDFDIQPSPVAMQRNYFLDEMMLALIRGRNAAESPADIADAFLALADARAKR